jgi:hypothetical protein
MHIGDVHIDQFGKIVSKAVVWNQKDKPSGHLIGLRR